MQTLIIGAGVAGLTLAALMRRRGESPVVIERMKTFDHLGYMLGLYYLGSRVLHGLGLFERYLSSSTPMREYNIYNAHGTLIHHYDLTEMIKRYGPIQGISRGALIRLLKESTGNLPIRLGTTVQKLEQRDDGVTATFNDGSTANFDLVIGADGLHSDTREMILSEDEYAYEETGWGGWVFWIDRDLSPGDTYSEYWGAGSFLGLYPVKDQLGVFIGGAVTQDKKNNLPHFVQEARERLKEARHPIDTILERIEPTTEAFFWDFHDCRAKHWRKNRIVLLGDAATGFLPTAGVGASMAMESAAVLNDELSRTNAADVPRALDLYEKRRRQRVEDAQTTSRQLGKMMFIDSVPVAWGRDQLVKLTSLSRLIKNLGVMMEEPI